MIKNPFKNTSKKKSVVLLLVGLLIVGGLAYGGYRIYQNHYHPTSIKTGDGKTVKLKPPTKQEQQQASDQKSEIVKREAQVNQNGAGSQQKPSTVVIVSASESSVRAYVTGVFEEGGTCTATATQGGQSISKSSTGFQNVSYTQCAPIEWDAQLGSGTWSLTVAYKSASTQSSQTSSIEVK